MFSLLKTDTATRARLGRLTTPHGDIQTPIFMPVGTQGTVKTLHPTELESLGAQIILGNTYHLFIRPGMEVISGFGGLHNFSNWNRPILTDSGGFQVWSLAKLRKITDDGVHFQSHIDGKPLFLGPDESMQIQAELGSDIAMLFDECPPYPCERPYAEKSLDLTIRWAKRCKDWIGKNAPKGQQHFAIVQGSIYADLRELCARQLVDLDLDGYAVGGVSVGEPEHEMLRAIDNTIPFLPEDKPRYAMGLGTPPQLLEMVSRGVDMFDCVMPTRLARHGTALTPDGPLNLKNSRFKTDPADLAEDTHTLCRGFPRAYIHHLLKANELLGIRLISLHNLHFYLNLMALARTAIANGHFNDFKTETINRYSNTKP